MVVASGGTQLGVTGATLGNPVAIRVINAQGQPVAGAPVAFQVMVGGGSVTPAQTQTGNDGLAQAVWTLGSVAGEQELQVSAMGSTLRVAATAAASPTSLVLQKISGDGQTGPPSTELGNPLVFRAVDGNGTPVAGLTVTWAVEGGGSMPIATAVTGSDGTATARWKLGASGAQKATATVPGAPAAVFDATVSVIPATVAAVRLQPDSLLLMLGDTGDFNAVALDADGNLLTGRTVTWTLTNPTAGLGTITVATLGEGGAIRAVTPGRATITATVEGVSVS
ncbi:MAG TPA: Ig-like domain-containing protein, partial [Archangium sp.]